MCVFLIKDTKGGQRTTVPAARAAIITHAAFRMKEEIENETLSPVCLEGRGRDHQQIRATPWNGILESLLSWAFLHWVQVFSILVIVCPH